MSKVHCLILLPTKYKNEIIASLVNQSEELSQEKQYKIVVDILSDLKKPSPKKKAPQDNKEWVDFLHDVEQTMRVNKAKPNKLENKIKEDFKDLEGSL